MLDPLFPVPVGWEVTTVAAIAARGGGNVQTGPFGSQLHAADYVEQGIPSVMPLNIGDNTISEEGIARIRVEDAERLTRYRLRTGDIVYSRRGDVEKRSLVRAANDGWLCGTGCLRIRFGEGHVVPEYAAYYLAHPTAKEWVVRHAVGATMPNLNTTILGSLPFVLPSMPEQAAIARILGSLDDKIELNRRMNETLEAMAQAIFRDWFVDFGPTRRKRDGATDPVTIMGGLVQDTQRAKALADLFPAALSDQGLPEGWKLGRLEDVVELAYGKSLPKDDRHKGDVPVYGSGGIGGFHDHALVQGPSVIVGRKGTVGSLFWEERAFFPIDTVFFVKTTFPMTYCYYLLRTLGLETMNTDAAVPGLNRNNAYRLEVATTDEAPILEFGKVADLIRSKISSNESESQTLAATRDLLLPKLMSGEINLGEAVEAAA